MKFEGRGSKRIDSENLLAYRLFDNEGKTMGEGMVKTIDISKTGIAISSKNAMEVGAKIELTIGMGDDIVKANGVIKNQNQVAPNNFHLGIEFDFLTEDDLNKIAMLYPSILK